MRIFHVFLQVYEDTSLSYFIDARDPKYGNWMNFIQCARNSMEQNLCMAQFNDNIYFVVTSDIVIGDELLVWYDQQQYDLYMGLPTGFREIPPPPLFLEQQQQTPQESASKFHWSVCIMHLIGLVGVQQHL